MPAEVDAATTTTVNQCLGGWAAKSRLRQRFDQTPSVD
jgi:hypothetical protein